ncbi:hypothetical protein PCE1_002382 [Barthelona sp. PCE]
MRTSFLLTFICFLAVIQGFSFRIDPKKQECFLESVKKPTPMAGSFSVTEGGLLDVDVRVLDPSLNVVYEANREQEGAFSFNADLPGVYKFCFNNHASMTPKVVEFNIIVGDSMGEKVGLAKKEHLNPLEDSILSLRNELRAISDEQRHLKARESRHRSTTESTNSRVLWFSLFECVVLIVVCALQVLYLRQLFSARRHNKL